MFFIAHDFLDMSMNLSIAGITIAKIAVQNLADYCIVKTLQ